jgi:hypothetical protein
LCPEKSHLVLDEKIPKRLHRDSDGTIDDSLYPDNRRTSFTV